MKFIALASIASAFALSATWAADAPTPDTAPKPNTTQPASKPEGPSVPIDLGPIHNSFQLGRKILSGSCPVGDAGFKALAERGVKTIISVDGARPDADLAAKYHMRYVHIPVPYSGITRPQALSIARAVRDLQGPVFIHCHHGIHRGPTAAVLAAMIDEGWTTEQGAAALSQAGTGTQYTGLWADVRNWKPATKAEIDAADATFPSAAPLEPLAASMVDIDEHWDVLGQSKAADWQAPKEHPDADAAHEALQLREAFHELNRAPATAQRGADFSTKMQSAETACAALEDALRAKDAELTAAAFKEVGASCNNCHAVYRNPDGLKADAK